MIKHEDGLFRLTSDHTSYWFRVTRFGHLEHIHYGRRLAEQDAEPLAVKRTAMYGSSVLYDESDPLYCLDTMALEWSMNGNGDYRHEPTELKMPNGSYACDVVFRDFRIFKGPAPMDTLPGAVGAQYECETLEITMADEASRIEMRLYYTVYEKTDVITRRAALVNRDEEPLTIRRFMSMMMDMPNRGFRIVTLSGGWIREAHRHEHPVFYGLFVNESTTGASGNRHNPGLLLAETGASETHGGVYGFNLVYSGNHYGAVELSAQDLVRVMIGISPHCFEWTLGQDERFETPEAVMTYSPDGFNGVSAHFHDFVNAHIVRGDWRDEERPVLVNSWEAHFFKFNRRSLLALARRAARLGVELFVLDDGWFQNRNDDRAGLGDYAVDTRKLPGGLPRLAKAIRRKSMRFGLWVEPEMVNADSELYRAHPDWAVVTPGKTPTLGRNQLVLDLCNPAVRDYIVGNVARVLDEADVSYVKWDMNRHISDAYSPLLSNQGEFYHRYVLGLYDVLSRIFGPRPHILLESCSSGGNRFDLGMLCFSPQIWASDNTDPVERLKIQGGLSYFYPLSAVAAHVSEAPHQQTLRATPLSTRFNAACFGCLGYEMDLKYLTRVQRKEIAAQIAFYKAHRRTFQYGRFSRLPPHRGNKVHWQCAAPDGGEAIAGYFQTQAQAAEGVNILPLTGFDPQRRYTVKTRPQSLFLRQFGALVKHILPVPLNPDGVVLRTLGRFYRLTDCVESYECCGDMLAEGLRLNNQFVGSYYNAHTRLLGDFGSNLYVITRCE